MPSRTPSLPSGTAQVDAVAQQLGARRRRRAEHDRAATEQVTKLISEGNGSGDRLSREISAALARATQEISAALNLDTENAAESNTAHLTHHLAQAAEALNVADVLATVLSAAMNESTRAAAAS